MRPSILHNVVMEICQQPDQGDVFPSERTPTSEQFFTRLISIADLDDTTRSNIYAAYGGDLAITHVVRAPRGMSVKSGGGLQCIKEKRGRSWQTLTPPIRYNVKRIVSDPGQDFVRIGLQQTRGMRGN